MSQQAKYPVGTQVLSLFDHKGLIHDGQTYGQMPAHSKGTVIYHTEDDGRAVIDFGEFGVRTFNVPEALVVKVGEPEVQPLTKEQLNLLLYLETAAVDYSGRINPERLNKPDNDQLAAWKEAGFLDYGRICAADINRDGSMWVRLSPDATSLALAERRARANRKWENRTWLTTEEKRKR